MNTSTLAQLEKIQKTLYEQAFERAKSIMFGESQLLEDYHSRYQAELPDSYTKSNESQLLKDISLRDFILFGDFHTLKQSQRGFLRIIKAFMSQNKDSKIVIALEAFRAINQDCLDRYIYDEISEEAFLDETEYYKYWNFPWANFKMILDFAKSERIEVYGINSSRGGKDSLDFRDRFIANQLTSIKHENPKSKIFCLIGELHLSQKHLPSYLERRTKAPYRRNNIVRILTNVDKYYFGLKKPDLFKSSEFLLIKKNLYCILNSPPWIKWQSFNMWEESRSDTFLDMEASLLELENHYESDLANNESHYDVESHFLNMVKIIANFFNVPTKGLELFDFHIITGSLRELDEYLRIVSKLSVKSRSNILEKLETQGNAYLQKKNTILMRKVAINSLSDMAGQFLFKQISKIDLTNQSRHFYFYYNCVSSALGLIASKIINPKRKVTNRKELKRFLNLHKEKRLQDKQKQRKLIAQSLLKHDEWIKRRIKLKKNITFVRPISKIYSDDEQTHGLVSKTIGQDIGNAIYNQIITNKIEKKYIRHIFTKEYSSFDDFWQTFIELYKRVS